MKDRLLLPILIPAGAALVIFLLIFSAGKILLEVDPAVATVLAITGASAILAISSIIAVAPRIPATQVSLAAGVPLAIVIGVGLFLGIRPQPSTGQAEVGPAQPGDAVATSLNEIATDNRFSATSFTVPVNTEITMQFENQGVALHNWRVLNVKDAGGNDIATQLLSGGKSETLKFTFSQTGSFPFQCDVHPTEMKGTITVVEAAAGVGAAPAGGGGGGGGQTIVATDNKFDKTQMSVAANTEAKVTLQNKGSALHNWRVLNVKDASGNDIATQLIGGGKSDTVTFTITTPGTYDYQCDVHPTEMRGKLTVQ